MLFVNVMDYVARIVQSTTFVCDGGFIDFLLFYPLFVVACLTSANVILALPPFLLSF